jgi:hypothetical protein
VIRNVSRSGAGHMRDAVAGRSYLRGSRLVSSAQRSERQWRCDALVQPGTGGGATVTGRTSLAWARAATQSIPVPKHVDTSQAIPPRNGTRVISRSGGILPSEARPDPILSFQSVPPVIQIVGTASLILKLGQTQSVQTGLGES